MRIFDQQQKLFQSNESELFVFLGSTVRFMPLHVGWLHFITYILFTIGVFVQIPRKKWIGPLLWGRNHQTFYPIRMFVLETPIHSEQCKLSTLLIRLLSQFFLSLRYGFSNFYSHSAKNTVYYRNTLIKMFVSRQRCTQIAYTFIIISHTSTWNYLAYSIFHFLIFSALFSFHAIQFVYI